MSDLRELPKAYDASAVEDAIYAAWEASGAFNPDQLPDRNQKGEPFCIMMPPPNVTGVLHLGHSLEQSIMDTTIRFQRMRGKKTLLVPGTDHAAIATQAKVEKMLMADGMKDPRRELGREKLVEKIREFAEESKATIIKQIRKMGTSADWSRLAYTFDEDRNRAVRELFVRMYKDGLIYRGYRVVNWSVKGQSTASDDEIEHIERPAKLYTFKYSKDFPITIASTRPETKLGDTAVAVHPSDKRYKKLIGQTFTVDVGATKPLEIKIIADESVDPEFGTGALGVTPAHSAIDFAMFEKQKAKGEPINLIPVIGADGKMTEEAGANYVGLSAEQAREKFVAWLKENDLLEKEEDIVQSIGTSDRYGDIIEAIPMTQWWLDMNKPIPSHGKTLRDLMRSAVLDNHIRISPDRFAKLYLDRIDNLRDWCLSRQLWWGHRIPVWYRGEEMFVGTEAPEGEGWEQDPDTLDTWFSSGSWTFSTLGWPDKTEDLKTFHPTSFMQMGYEILYLWMMRMILMSEYALGEIPFKEVYIHGIVRDEHGAKFSKSSGNGIDPIEVIEKYGTDALRMSILSGTTPGNDSRFYMDKVEAGRNLVNKLWNISRFILLQLEDEKQKAPGTRTLADDWILSRLADVNASVTSKLEAFQYSSAGEELRDFTWNDLADWYLEVAKVEGGKADILKSLLNAILRMWHPFMPFVTEHIWKLMDAEGHLMVAEWPEYVNDSMGRAAEFEKLRLFVTDIRRLRAEQGVDATKKIAFGFVADEDAQGLIGDNLEWIKRLTNTSSIDVMNTMPDNWVVATSGTSTIGFNKADGVDLEAERVKLEKELVQLEAYIKTTDAKLSDAEFSKKAPENVVRNMSDKLEEAKEKAKVIKSRLS
jgi:valyl-tRNA synthetase